MKYPSFPFLRSVSVTALIISSSLLGGCQNPAQTSDKPTGASTYSRPGSPRRGADNGAHSMHRSGHHGRYRTRNYDGKDTVNDPDHSGPRPLVIVKFLSLRESYSLPEPTSLVIELTPQSGNAKPTSNQTDVGNNIAPGNPPDNDQPQIALINVHHSGPRPLVVVLSGPLDPSNSSKNFVSADHGKVIVVHLPQYLPSTPTIIPFFY